ncbi:MAG: MtnX-like HAD-IB family phosphatase [Opitutales bacterium]
MSLPPPLEVYFDFDNTITEFDVLDDLITRFARDDSWQQVELDWQAGRIGSRECLERQFATVRLTAAGLEDYLRTIRIDPAFPRIVALLRSRGIEPVIVSDSFTTVIGRVLGHHGLTGLPILANELTIAGDELRLSFPYFHSICTRCGNCKTSHLMRRDRAPGTRKVYVGDGQSDVCPAGFCEILFAKGSLLRHYAPLRPDCRPFETLETVHTQLQQLLS